MTETPEQGRALGALLDELTGAFIPPGAGEVRVREISADSRHVGPGTLFVALSGTRVDAHDFLDEVVERGAAAIVAERPPEKTLSVPVVVVADTRVALARLASAWHGHPAERLRMAGVTGTVGKTSVVKMMEAILLASGTRVGTIGTLGVSGPAIAEDTGYTAPDALLLHEALARLVAAGCELAAMEVTSHALDQDRVHGLTYEIGVFTNLVPLEHADYHGTFRNYVEVKRRFLDHLVAGAPIVYSHDDAVVRRVATRSRLRPVGCGRSEGAAVGIEDVRISPEGTSLRVVFRRPLPLVSGGTRHPGDFPLRLRLLGRPSVTNAVLAATAALSLGVETTAVQEALGQLEPLARRMSILHSDGFLLLDDAANHPDSVSALFEVVEQLPIRRAHALFAVRGQRGPRINRRTAEALAIWANRRPLDTLVLTRSADVVSERDHVEPAELEAFRGVLRKAGIEFRVIDTLEEAVPAVLDRVGEGDLVLLLGAQGMDAGPEKALRWIRENRLDAAPGAAPAPTADPDG
jgi:UDP-N-acetylmuramoyl-L-alanyl-D-glutamate--2,6-diaminopimelate ligase